MTADTTARRDSNRPLRLLLAGVAVVLLAGLAAGLAARLFRPTLELDAAEEYLRRHDFPGARERVERVLARQPSNERALLLAARVARRSHDYAAAERSLGSFEDVAGPTDASRLEWALLAVQQGDFDTHEPRLRAAVGRDSPDAAAILEALGTGYALAYRWPDAIETLSRLIDRAPDHVPALVQRAAIWERLRRYDSAETDLNQAVARRPDSAQAHAAYAAFLGSRGHTREAIHHYELARQTTPPDAAQRIGFARVLADAAELTRAERELDELLAQQPDHPDGLVERGRLSLRRNKPAEAEAFLVRAVRVAPWHRDGNQLLLLALRDLGRVDDATRCEARLAQLREEDATAGRLKLRARDNPADAALRMELYRWSVRNGQPDEAVVWLAEILAVDPRHAAARAAMAEHFETAGQPRRAAHHRAAAGQ